MRRREALKLLSASLAAGACAPCALAAGLPWDAAADRSRATPLTAQDEALLNELERRGCLYFGEQADPTTGQVLDRARDDNSAGTLDPRRLASIAATGFGLAALCIADRRRYLPRPAVLAQVRRTLAFHANVLPNEHGFFFHFNDRATGTPAKGSEVSSIDTCLLLCGVLTARAYFQQDAEIVRYATEIYERVDWPWMLDGGQQFRMGWHPPNSREPGFLTAAWNHYSEMMMLPLLAMGSPTYPVDAAVWHSFSRPTITYDGLTYISGNDPLFTHQYSHAFFDFRHVRDQYANYFTNSVLATRAHKAFCLSLGEPYTDVYWGISASDSATGYQAWGGPPAQGRLDGTVVPYATAGSLPFLPAACLRVQHALKTNFGDRGSGRYGLCDALHPAANWYDPDVLGIDLGISVVMAENLRSGLIWETFKRNPEVPRAMKKAGFHIELT